MFEFEGWAIAAVNETKSFIDVENHIIILEHKLRDAILGWHNIIGYIMERLPGSSDLHILNGTIAEILDDITIMLESDELKETQFLKEETTLLDKLEQDTKNKSWRIIKLDIKNIKSSQKEFNRLKHSELKKLHNKFKELSKIINDADLSEDSKTAVFFIHIQKFSKSYETILGHLWKKELVLNSKI